MESKVYKYMDWPEIEAVVYAEEASPKDLMAPRLTADGILIQGFFPDAEKAEVLADKKAYEMEKQDDAGYFAAMIPGRKIPAYQYRITRGKETRTFADPYAFPGQITEAEEKAFCAGVFIMHMRSLELIRWKLMVWKELHSQSGHQMHSVSA